MILKDIDTTKFLVDPKSKAFIQDLLDISKIFDLKINGVSRKKILVWMALVYDKESYFRKDVKNFHQRKYEAGVCAGFKLKEDNTFDERIEKVMVGESDDFNRCVVQYVTMHFNLEYAKLVIFEYNFYKLWQRSLAKFDDQGKMKTLMDELGDSINELEVKLFGGQETMNAIRALYEGTARSKLNLRPEQMESEYNANKLLGLNPWGDYVPSTEVNFVGDEIPKD